MQLVSREPFIVHHFDIPPFILQSLGLSNILLPIYYYYINVRHCQLYLNFSSKTWYCQYSITNALLSAGATRVLN